MSGNVNNLERLIRIIAGFGMVVTGIIMQGTTGCVLTWVGLIPLITGMMGTCPLYSFFGLNSKVCCK